MCGRSRKVFVLFMGVLIVRALLFEVRAPDFWKLSLMAASGATLALQKDRTSHHSVDKRSQVFPKNVMRQNRP